LVLYHLNEGTGTAAADSSGNANNAALSSANWNTNAWMGAAAMGAEVTLTPGAVPALGTSDWTIEFWVYSYATNDNTGNHFYPTAASGPGGQLVQFDIRYLSPTMRWQVNLHDNSTHSNAASWYNVAVAGLPAWLHIAIVKNGNTLRYYVNGVQNSTLDVTGWTWSAWTGRTWVTDAYTTSIDEIRDSATAVYPNGTTFYPVRYPASGTWTEASGEAAVGVTPGVLTVTLNAALPTGTSLKCKLLGHADTGWQTMTGAGTSYTYDFTGQAAGDWYAAVQLFTGGAMNVNTPEVSAVAFEYTVAVTSLAVTDGASSGEDLVPTPTLTYSDGSFEGDNLGVLLALAYGEGITGADLELPSLVLSFAEGVLDLDALLLTLELALTEGTTGADQLLLLCELTVLEGVLSVDLLTLLPGLYVVDGTELLDQLLADLDLSVAETAILRDLAILSMGLYTGYAWLASLRSARHPMLAKGVSTLEYLAIKEKSPDDEIPNNRWVIDFTPRLYGSEEVISAEVVVTDMTDGTDVTAALVEGEPVIGTGNLIGCKFVGGEADHVYRVSETVTTDAGGVYEEFFAIRVALPPI
jgi:hypothetical protein